MSINTKISPSILSADFAKLGQEITDIDKAGADYIHIDVMDGNFVPNLTIGPDVVKSIRKYSDKIFDVHLMIDDPDFYAEKFRKAGADIITFHAEAVEDIAKSIKIIKDTGAKVGISIKPDTPIDVITDFIQDLDLILIMTVNPGFGGQKFIDSQLEKISALRKIINDLGKDIDLEVDGGINSETAKLVINSGANVLVAGSAIFTGDRNNYKHNIERIRDFIK